MLSASLRGFGKIRDINLKQGYGFVELEDARDADDAVYDMNNQSLGELLLSMPREFSSQETWQWQGVTDTGAAGAFMAAEEEARAVMTAAASITGKGPNTIQFWGLSTDYKMFRTCRPGQADRTWTICSTRC